MRYYEYRKCSTNLPDNSCPSDLNEDGTVGFNDLLQVLSDYAGGRYRVDGFNAILKVLSGMGRLLNAMSLSLGNKAMLYSYQGIRYVQNTCVIFHHGCTRRYHQ